MKEIRLQDLNNNAFHGRKISKTAACFICGKDYPRDSLAQHEKDCLASIQENDTQYTRGTEHDSTLSTRSVRSANSTSSTGSDKAADKKYDRCYICGSDVPAYLKSTHERNCKRSWELGLLSGAGGSLRRQSSRGGLSHLGNGADSHVSSGGSLRRTKSSGNVGSELVERSRAFSVDAKRAHSVSRKPSSGLSTSHRDLTPVASANSPVKTSDTPSPDTHQNLTRVVSAGTTRPTSAPIGKATSKYSKSQSMSNLSQAPPIKVAVSVAQEHVPAEQAKPSQEVSGMKLSSPQYVSCACCGKLYSVHSIGIHQPQCERTRHLQKAVGLDPDSKRKSKSVSDIRSLASRLKSSISRNLGAEKQQVKPVSSAGTAVVLASKHERDRSSSLSKGARPESVSAFMSRRVSADRFVLDLDGSVPESNMSPSSTSDPASPVFPPSSEDSVFDEAGVTETSPRLAASDSPVLTGFLKCSLCHQVYGSRSLAIHEKQCLKKLERLSKEEKEKDKLKRQNLREIQLIPFGRSKQNSEAKKGSPESLVQPEPSAASLPLPSDYGTPVPLHTPLRNIPASQRKAESGGLVLKSRKLKVSQAHLTAPDDGFSTYAAEQAANPRFVTCDHCGRQYGAHSVAFHEKSCRLKRSQISGDDPDKLNPVLEEGTTRYPVQTKSVNKKSDARPLQVAGLSPSTSKSLGERDLADSSNMAYPSRAIASGEPVQLVACVDCKRRFLRHDIERHKLHCRIKS